MIKYPQIVLKVVTKSLSVRSGFKAYVGRIGCVLYVLWWRFQGSLRLHKTTIWSRLGFMVGPAHSGSPRWGEHMFASPPPEPEDPE